MQGKGVGLFVLNYNSGGSMNRYGYSPYMTVFHAGIKIFFGKNFQRQSG